MSRPDASMSLLRDIERDALDPGYRAATEARYPGAAPRRRGPARAALTVAAALIGFLLATAALTLTGPARRTDPLTERVRERQEQVEARAAEVQAADRLVARLRADLLSADGRADLEANARALESEFGAVALAGPGIRITLDDAAGGGELGARGARDRDAVDARVVGRDLQHVTNALWAAGAEAVAVNEHRLTSTSAIRDAGEAILVGFRPLARPYHVVALGGPDLVAGFRSGPGGEYLRELRAAFGAVAQESTAERLVVPAAPRPQLHHARVAAGDVGDTEPSRTPGAEAAP